MKNLIFLVLTAVCWGPSYLFIKIGITAVPPFTLVLIRMSLAALILHIYCKLKKTGGFYWRQQWKHYLILGLTLNVFPLCLICYGEMYISSSIAGIINSTTLIFTVIVAYFFGSQEILSKHKIMGMITGIIGLMVIYFPMLVDDEGSSGIGIVLLLLSCLCYGIGTVYVRKHLKKVKGPTVLTAQVTIATLILLPCAFIFDRHHLTMPTLEAILGIVGLAAIGTVLGFLSYYKVIELAGSTYASFTSLLVPIFAMLLGTIVLHEKLAFNHYLGAFFILSGVLVMNSAKKIKIDSLQSTHQ